MSKSIRKKISHAIQTAFRLSPQHKQASKIISCCSVKKPNDYDHIPHQPKQTSTKHDYIDLSECYSWYLSDSKDSGISSIENSYQFESSRIFPDDAYSLSTVFNLSPIPTSFECCHCQCHRSVNNQTKNDLYTSERHQQKFTKDKIYPFIF